MYKLTAEQLGKLDTKEGVLTNAYTRGTVMVKLLDTDDCIEVVTYFAVAECGGPFVPSCGYMQKLIAGAEENGLSPDYVERLRQIATAGQNN